MQLSPTWQAGTAAPKKHKFSVTATVCNHLQGLLTGPSAALELHVTFLRFHGSHHDSHSLHLVGTARSEFRKGRSPWFPGYPDKDWAQRCPHLPLPGVSEAFTQNILESTVQHSKSALELSWAQVYKQCTLALGTFVVPVTQMLCFTDPCARIRFISYCG